MPGKAQGAGSSWVVNKNILALSCSGPEDVRAGGDRCCRNLSEAFVQAAARGEEGGIAGLGAKATLPMDFAFHIAGGV